MVFADNGGYQHPYINNPLFENSRTYETRMNSSRPKLSENTLLRDYSVSAEGVLTGMTLGEAMAKGSIIAAEQRARIEAAKAAAREAAERAVAVATAAISLTKIVAVDVAPAEVTAKPVEVHTPPVDERELVGAAA